MQLLQIQEPSIGKKNNKVAVGIDFGTTNSLVAVSKNKEIEIFSDNYHNKKIPSVVSITSDKRIFVGSKAEEMIGEDNIVSVRSIKRLIGKKSKDVERSFSAKANIVESGDDLYLSLNGLDLSVEEIAAKILAEIKEIASKNLEEDIENAVITVPAYFDEIQRRVVKTAAESVGINVMRMINEPTAAALAYQLDKISKGTYLVYDLGGGTFDVSILDIQKGVFRVIATGGDSNLGGDDFDFLIAQEIEKKVKGIKFSSALRNGSKIKEGLTNSETSSMVFDGVSFSVSKEYFQDISKSLLDKTLKITKNTLSDANLDSDGISGIILVGGSTRMPFVKESLKMMFKEKDFYDSINPDEVVAIGASLQAENLMKGSGDLLLDITPLSLGLEIMGGLNEKIIPRNSSIPCSVSKEFTTHEDGQTGLVLHVTQGERELAKDCRSLDEFELKGIPAMEAGTARINVNFTIDADGLLTVSAEEKITGIKQSVEIVPTHGLSKGEVHKSIRNSMENVEKDHKERVFVESKLSAENIISRVSACIEEDKDLLTGEEYNSICKKITLAKNSVETQDVDRVNRAVQALENSMEEFFTRRLKRRLDMELGS